MSGTPDGTSGRAGDRMREGLPDGRTGSARHAYAASGVDLDVNARTKEGIRAAVESTSSGLVEAGFGSFGGALSIPSGYREPVLVSSVDGVGTKLHLAIEWGRPEVAGRDVVNHGIDDVAVLNARPLAFLDYIASGDLAAAIVVALVNGMAAACREAGVALIGGETAQLPDTYVEGAYDVAGTMIGIAERSGLPKPARVSSGDRVVGVPSVGLHTNGFSLARQTADALGPDYPVANTNLADALLAPHPSYLTQIQAAFAVAGVRTMAHITGGGLEENLPRVLPAHLAARLDVSSWQVPAVFDVIERERGLARREMYQVFNMGIGLAIIVAADAVEALLDAIPGSFMAGSIVDRADAAVILEGS